VSELKRVIKISLIFLLGLLFVACDQTTETTVSYLDLDYGDFPGQFITEVDNQLNMSETDYYVYYYGPRCSACEIIKPQALDKFYRAKETTIYFVTVMSLNDIDENSGVKATPTIIRVVDNEVVEFYAGVSQIQAMLDDIT
jgi:hypothetical protein